LAGMYSEGYGGLSARNILIFVEYKFILHSSEVAEDP